MGGRPERLSEAGRSIGIMASVSDRPAGGKPIPGPGPSATTRVLICVGLGVLVALVLAISAPWWVVPLGGWIAAALVFVTWMWHSLEPLDGPTTAARARREDPSRTSSDVLLVAASLVSLLAVGLVLVKASKLHGLDKGLLVGACVFSIVLSWSVVHTVYTLRYARHYYGGRASVDFNEDDLPVYADFAYLALTIGMTFQVSDTNLKTRDTRRLALGHALLSYAFGSLIVASTVNLIAGLGK